MLRKGESTVFSLNFAAVFFKKRKTMKKNILFTVAFVAAMTLASCGGKNNTPATTNDSTETVADTRSDADAAAASVALAPETQQAMTSLTDAVSTAIEKKDPKAVTTALANVAATYKALVNAGKLDEAKNYGTAVKNFVSKNATALKSLASDRQSTAATTINSLVSGIEALPTTASTTADEAKAAVTEEVVNLASPYIQKGAAAAATAETAAAAIKNAPQTVKAAAENAANEAVDNAKAAAKTAVDNEVNKAASKVNDASTKAQEKAADEVNKTQKKANDAVNKALKGLGL